MPRTRNRLNRRYPTNWRVRQVGARWYISFRVPLEARSLWGGKAEAQIGKGSTLHAAESQAYAAWAKKAASSETPPTIGAALDRYLAQVVPEKAPATQQSNRYSIRRLRQVIPEHMPVTAFESHHAYQYRDQCARLESPKKANLDLEVLSHVFTKCLEWGVPGLREHPIRGKVRKLPLAPRDRYIEDWELDAFLSVAGPMLRVYVPLKYALGIDKGMMLGIRMSDILPDRLKVPKRRKIADNARAKGKEYLFEADGQSTGLRELLDAVIAWRRDHLKISSLWLFCTSAGQPYIRESGSTSGFDSIWQRAIKRALDTTPLQQRFTEHDLCAKTASDLDTAEQAQKLRGHINPQTTVAVYRRKPEAVIPLHRPRNGEKPG